MCYIIYMLTVNTLLLDVSDSFKFTKKFKWYFIIIIYLSA